MSTDGLVSPAGWLSPAFPTGAFSYSHGLEAAAETGRARPRHARSAGSDGDRAGQRPDRCRHPARRLSRGAEGDDAALAEATGAVLPTAPRRSWRWNPGSKARRFRGWKPCAPCPSPLGRRLARCTALMCRSPRKRGEGGPRARRLGGICHAGGLRRRRGRRRHRPRRCAARLSAGVRGKSDLGRAAARDHRADRRAAHPRRAGAGHRRGGRGRAGPRPARISAARPSPSISPRWRTKPSTRGCSAHDRSPHGPAAHRHRRAGRLGQDRADGPAVQAHARPLRDRRDHQRHLYPRGRRVPDPQRRAAARAHPRRRDRRLPAHRDPRGRLDQPRRGRRDERACFRGSTDPDRVRAATTWRRPSRRSWPTSRST